MRRRSFRTAHAVLVCWGRICLMTLKRRDETRRATGDNCRKTQSLLDIYPDTYLRSVVVALRLRSVRACALSGDPKDVQSTQQREN